MNDASEFWQAIRDYNKEREEYIMEAKSYPMINTGKKNPVIKEAFEDRMNMRKLEARVNAIEKKQAERFPMLMKRLDELGKPHFGLFNIERIERIENSFPAIVTRLEQLENRQNAAMYNDSEMDYSGAFESDIDANR